MISTSELAKLAGVSQSTVSRCLNDHPSISFETKERVRKLALQYGYVEHKRGSRTYFTEKKRVIGILVEDRPFFDDLFINYTIGRLISTASKKNYYTVRLPISSREEGSMEKLKEFMKVHMIDGFIILHRHFDETIHDYLLELGVPHVYLLHCSRNSFEAVDMIDTDNYIGGYLATKHLMEYGHRDILTLTCPWREFEDRSAGYRFAFTEKDLKVNEAHIITTECSYDAAYDVILNNKEMLSQVTAIYAQSDIMAAGVINALHALGIRVPQDMSLIGSDGYDLGRIFSPQFDSVAHPIKELADLAITRLLEIVNSKRQQTPRQIMLRPYIIERNSVQEKL